jgi:putative ATP-binding cassette transporter
MTAVAVAPAAGEARLLARFWRSARGYWTGRGARAAWGLTALLLVTIVLQLLTQYGLNVWNRDFFNAIGRRDGTALLHTALAFLPLALASLGLALVSVWGRMTLQRGWRCWISTHLYALWLGRDRVMRLHAVPEPHQAPEYRIAEDARVATDLPVDLVLGLLSAVLSAITFIAVLWRVGGALALPVDGVTVTIPGYLVLAVVLYSLGVAAATWLIGRRLTAVMEETKRSEAELRALGTHLREMGDGLVPADDLAGDTARLHGALGAVIAAWRLYCWQLVRVTVVTHSNFLLAPVVALLLCMPKYLAGTMTLGEAVQAAAAFAVVQTACNWFTDNYPKLAEWTASANRVAELLLALDRIDGREIEPPRTAATAGRA